MSCVLSGGAPVKRPRPPDIPKAADVAIVGAGIIGMSIAWRLAREGLDVAVFDRGGAGQGATYAATGMLAAAAELEPGGEELLSLCLESQKLWPAFRDELEAESGIAIDYRDEGTLVVALGREEVERLRFRHDLQKAAGLQTQWLNGLAARELEPGLRPNVGAGISCPQDHQVDPRLVTAALVQALRRHDVRLVEHCGEVAPFDEGGSIAGVRRGDDICRAPVVIAATGAWSGSGAMLADGARIPVRPLKGQALSLRSPQGPGIAHVVWTNEIHLAPKADGRLVVGATVEEAGFDEAVTAGGVYALLEAARRVLPSIEEMRVEAIWSGFRPTSDDDAPIIGPAGRGGLVLATGHHRNGVLLAPVTARAIAELVLRGALPESSSAFGLDRFTSRIRKDAS
jgi:glycine oxidase